MSLIRINIAGLAIEFLFINPEVHEEKHLRNAIDSRGWIYEYFWKNIEYDIYHGDDLVTKDLGFCNRHTMLYIKPKNPRYQE